MTCRELGTRNQKTPTREISTQFEFALTEIEARVSFSSCVRKASEVLSNLLSFPRLC